MSSLNTTTPTKRFINEDLDADGLEGYCLTTQMSSTKMKKAIKLEKDWRGFPRSKRQCTTPSKLVLLHRRRRKGLPCLPRCNPTPSQRTRHPAALRLHSPRPTLAKSLSETNIPNSWRGVRYLRLFRRYLRPSPEDGSRHAHGWWLSHGRLDHE